MSGYSATLGEVSYGEGLDGNAKAVEYHWQRGEMSTTTRPFGPLARAQPDEP
jgi:hypothetical protein